MRAAFARAAVASNAGRHDQIRRIARHPAAGDAHLHDVGAAHHDVEQRRGLGLARLVAETDAEAAETLAQERAQIEPLLLAPGRAVRPGGRVGARDPVLVQQIGVQVHGDHDLGAHGAAQGDRHRVHQAAVEQPAPVALHGGDDAGQSDRGAHGIEHGSLLQPDLVPALQVGRDHAERAGQVAEPWITEMAAKEFEQLARPDQSAGEAWVQEADYLLPGEFAHPGVQLLELAASIGGPDQGPDRGSGDQLRMDPARL